MQEDPGLIFLRQKIYLGETNLFFTGSLNSKSLFQAALFTGLHEECMLFGLTNDVLLLHFSFEASQCALQRFSILYIYISQGNTPLIYLSNQTDVEILTDTLSLCQGFNSFLQFPGVALFQLLEQLAIHIKGSNDPYHRFSGIFN